MADKLIQLRKLLEDATDVGNLDIDSLMKLTNALAAEDTNVVRFSTDAGIIDRLGRELVGRQETALTELVKNSFDADATNVTLTFENFAKTGGRLTIEDNGNGMSRQEIVTTFMRLSSTGKIKEPLSPRFHRKRAGRKGIGRFATQRLGRVLEIETQSRNSAKRYLVKIDWRKFSPDVDLATISNTIEEVLATETPGTILTIDLLEDSWSETSIRRVYRYLLDLLQPYPLSTDVGKVKTTRADETDPGFNVEVYTVIENQKDLLINRDEAIFTHAVAEIEGTVVDGVGVWNLSSEKLDLNEKGPTIFRNKEQKYKYLDGVHFKVYYFLLRKAGYVPRLLSASLESFLAERGGIRVYRNGFRVLPYGEPKNDWLGLDFAHGRRAILPPASNENFLGFVEISDLEGQLFQETSSREGLIDNEAYQELVDFVFKAVKAAILRVAEARNRKKTASQKGWEKNEPSPMDEIDEAIDEIEKITSELADLPTESDKGSGGKADIFNVALDKLRDARANVATREIELLEEVSMLRVLAALGLSIATFTHEIKHNYGVILSDTSQLLKTTTGPPHDIAERLDKHLQSFRTYSAYFDKVVSANVHRDLIIQDLSSIVRQFTSLLSPAAERYAIKLISETDGSYDIFTCPMHWSEWISILLNLFTNAQKAIQRANKGDGRILVRVGKEDSLTYLEFFDNGDGILPENTERIFSPFFTTDAPPVFNAGDADVLTGTGLGLKIIRDTVESYDGSVFTIEPDSDYSTCFRIEVPGATQEQIKEHGY